MNELNDRELREIVEKIKASVEFLANFENQELIELLKASSLKKVKQGEVIFSEGEIGKEMYIVVYGKVTIIKHGKSIQTLSSGECFGEMGIIDKSPRAATVKASEDSLLVVVNEEILESTQVGVRLKLYKNFALTLARRLRESI